MKIVNKKTKEEIGKDWCSLCVNNEHFRLCQRDGNGIWDWVSNDPKIKNKVEKEIKEGQQKCLNCGVISHVSEDEFCSSCGSKNVEAKYKNIHFTVEECEGCRKVADVKYHNLSVEAGEKQRKISKKIFQEANAWCDCSLNRERENQRNFEQNEIKQYLKDNKIKSIELNGDDLLITYNDNQTKTISANSKELKQIKSYLQSQGKKSVSLTELNQIQSKKNYWPWIIGSGIILAGIIGLVIWLVMRKKKEDK
ncbi:hypothetical protein [endosymbiont GvMRE of Glomus versiforme]|uniref:hypothetical protein n=1 Tax=endosymbiont GvMRE of Glomus versiforme TaxID=2039283 RepID=UPI000EE69E25|nr:hypothetical protein [endosymbiont GvMRE of Glomus versiforme]RHZ36312.1 hypothetical protein GvMRE_Ic1g49 [endosymbiont GvMRE of Glomus versiforme]RHZ37755.1 hypothetical protein GvMRE_I1g691 [endosymbiont GvMRE of Glomus versiforme]